MWKRKSDDVAEGANKLQKKINEKNWISLFHLNQFAYAVWNYFTICEVLLLCVVNSSWKNRIWQFEDRSIQSLVKSGIIKRKKRQKLRRMKLASVKESISDILVCSSKTVTSSTNQYLFHRQVMSFNETLPIQSRLRALCSLASNIRELQLNNNVGKTSRMFGVQNMQIIAANCIKIENLYLYGCGVNGDLFPLLERFKKLRRLVLQDWNSSSGPFFGVDDLKCFYDACSELVEVALLTPYLGFLRGTNFDDICHPRFFRFQLKYSLHKLIKPKHPHHNLKHLSCWKCGDLATPNLVSLNWFNMDDFKCLTSVDIEMNTLGLDAIFLQRLSTFPNLKKLRFFCNGVYCTAMTSDYEQFPHFANLESLSFVGFRDEEMEQVKEILKRCTHLKQLTVLNNCDIFEWTLQNFDDVLSPLLLLPANQLTELCFCSVPNLLLSYSTIVQRFAPIFVYDNDPNLFYKSTHFL